jgi:hypothetical protein
MKENNPAGDVEESACKNKNFFKTPYSENRIWGFEKVEQP